MPKTTKKFEWEVYKKNGDFIDLLTMTRDEMKRYKQQFPNYIIKEIEYRENENLY